MPAPTSAHAAPRKDHRAPQAFDFRRLLNVFLEKLWILVTFFVVAAVLTLYYLQKAPRIYASTATLQVEQEEERVVKVEKVMQEDLRSMEILKTIEQILMSRALFDRVIKANDLAKDPRFLSPLAPKPTDEQMARMLSGMVSVRLRRGTRLMDVTVAHPSAELTEKVANSIVREFVRMNFDQQAGSAQLANEFLLDEAQRLKRKLQESETALQAYKEKTKAVSVEERQDIVIPNLKEVSTRVTSAKSERVRLEAEYAQVTALSTNVEALLIQPAVANDSVIAGLQSSVLALQTEFATLQQRYKEKHPKYIQMETRLTEARNSLTNAVLKVPDTLRSALASARAGEAALENALREQETAALELNKLSLQYNSLSREVESDRAMYQTVINRLKETALTKELQTSKVRILQPAYVPENPVSPDRRQVLIRGLMAGLVGGILLILLLNALDTTLKTVDQAEELLGIPALGAIPNMSAMKRDKSELVTVGNPKSSGAEAFRSLRTSLTMLGREEERRTFLFTSAVPQEGKTFCSVNCAASMAQQGLRTVLIDGDLRRPSVEQVLLGKRTKAVGLTDYLTGQKSTEEIVQVSEIENLFYIPSGTTAPNPAELLARGGLDALISELLLRYDRVVVDSAPIHAVSDTLLMIGWVQTVCLVVRSNKTPAKAVLRAVQMLQQNRAPLAGMITNRMRRGMRGYYYDPYYDYAYHGKYADKGIYGN